MTFPNSRAFSVALGTFGLLLGAGPVALAQHPTPAPTPPSPAASAAAAPAAAAGVASVRGTVLDSLHGTLLVHALVRIDSSTREVFTDSVGHYRIDSVPVGEHRLVIMHPILDTLGVSLVTPPIQFAAGEDRVLDLAIPTSESLVSLFCTPARRALGPAALVGFVRDADTQAAAVGAKVSLLWYESDPLGLRKSPRVREATIGADGRYRICGLPQHLDGKLQVFKGGVNSGEVPVAIGDDFLALRSMSISSTARVIAAAPDTSGKKGVTIVRGDARVTGRVLNKAGQPVANARVELQGTGAATLTRNNGEFVLDSLPSGTQTLEVRQLGYSPTEVAVELTKEAPQRVTVRMSDYVPVLQTMRVTASRERGLMDVGFNERKRTGMGYYMDGDRINHESLRFSDVLRTAPGIRVTPSGDGSSQVVQSSRDPMGGCVNFYVDGAPWQQQFPGDLDSFVRPDEVAAIEIYQPSTVPMQFTSAGQSSCTTVVVWTERRVMRKP